MRIGFLYNHDALHQIAHTAPIIAELQRLAPTASIEILVSSDAQHHAVAAYLDPSLPRPAVRHLDVAPAIRLIEKLTGGIIPVRRLAALKTNLETFRAFDALIVPETTSSLLKTRFKLENVKLIYLPHGAGDRSVGFQPVTKHFDFVLLSGEKVRDRMLEDGIIRQDAHAVVGYPKFDVLREGARPKFFDNDRPTVLYNPHFDPVLSSWYDMGEAVLDHFATQDMYNLIFAPHVMLFRRRLLGSTEHRKLRFRRAFPDRFRSAKNILVDLGSPRSVDMSYTRAADIYLGDASSQIYEFIVRPRPAIFINSHKANWTDNQNYAHWKFGPVINDLAELSTALHDTVPLPDSFRKAQAEAVRRTFSTDPDQSASKRAAEAIRRFLYERTQNC